MKIHERLPQMAWAAARPALSLGLQASRFLRRLHRNNLLLWRASQSRERAAFNNLLPQPWRYRELVGGSLLASLRDYDPFDALREHYESAQDVDALSMMQYVDLKAYLCDDILVKVDRASMAHALEVRCPLLDYRIVEFAARIPADARRADGKSKAPLRAAIADRIDPTFFDREKQGFAIPAGHWFRTALKTSGGRMFFSRRGGQSGLLDPLGLRRLWSEHQVGAADHGAQLYNAMMFEHWFERYIDRVAEPIEPTAAMQRAAPTQTMNGPAFEGRADPSPP